MRVVRRAFGADGSHFFSTHPPVMCFRPSAEFYACSQRSQRAGWAATALLPWPRVATRSATSRRQLAAGRMHRVGRQLAPWRPVAPSSSRLASQTRSSSAGLPWTMLCGTSGVRASGRFLLKSTTAPWQGASSSRTWTTWQRGRRQQRLHSSGCYAHCALARLRSVAYTCRQRCRSARKPSTGAR